MAKFWDQHAKTVLWSAVGFAAITIGADYYWHNRPEPEPPAQPSEGGCIELGAATFCHALTHVDTFTWIGKQPFFSRGEKASLYFQFSGSRSCALRDETYTIEFEHRWGDIPTEVISDYPVLVEEIMPSERKLNRYKTGTDLLATSKTEVEDWDAELVGRVFGIKGNDKSSQRFFFERYFTVDESAEACRAFAESQIN